ncbi:hypothetical protein Hanom_Chr16g01510361 [Helianthus anomalus]
MYVIEYVCMCKDMYECMHVCKVVGKICMYVDVNVCSYVSTLYESRINLTRSSDRRPSHKIDCTGMFTYVI